jgi:hypothetical protein
LTAHSKINTPAPLQVPLESTKTMVKSIRKVVLSTGPVQSISRQVVDFCHKALHIKKKSTKSIKILPILPLTPPTSPSSLRGQKRKREEESELDAPLNISRSKKSRLATSSPTSSSAPTSRPSSISQRESSAEFNSWISGSESCSASHDRRTPKSFTSESVHSFRNKSNEPTLSLTSHNLPSGLSKFNLQDPNSLPQIWRSINESKDLLPVLKKFKATVQSIFLMMPLEIEFFRNSFRLQLIFAWEEVNTLLHNNHGVAMSTINNLSRLWSGAKFEDRDYSVALKLL